ncbi:MULTISPECIES: hypothetical protein [unclassified Collinsella]|uniref:hypothetical protein n=1 Tax=unclassified Collinsella TaxID=2637548 RepID=UPI002A3447F6|nr:hypothetical protein [Collinsella sp.]MDD6556741.1 hypothetical protein [Collinsella sp.]
MPSLLEACDALLDERGFRGSAKAGISVFDDDFGLHAQQVAPSACSTNATWPASRCSPRIRSLCRF